MNVTQRMIISDMPSVLCIYNTLLYYWEQKCSLYLGFTLRLKYIGQGQNNTAQTLNHSCPVDLYCGLNTSMQINIWGSTGYKVNLRPSAPLCYYRLLQFFKFA